MDAGLETFLIRLANPHLERIMQQEALHRAQAQMPGMLMAEGTQPGRLTASGTGPQALSAQGLFGNVPPRRPNPTGSAPLNASQFAGPTPQALFGNVPPRRPNPTGSAPLNPEAFASPQAMPGTLQAAPAQASQPARIPRSTEPVPTRTRVTSDTAPMPQASGGRSGRETVDIRSGNGRRMHETMAPGTLTAAPAAAGGASGGGSGARGTLPPARVVSPQPSLGARAATAGSAAARPLKWVGRGLRKGAIGAGLGLGAATVGALMLQNKRDQQAHPQIYANLGGLA